MKSLKSKIVASVIAFTLVGGAFAQNSFAGSQEPKKAVDLRVKKVLNLPEEGVTTPNETFTFTFEKVGKNGTDDQTDMPDLGPKTVVYNNTKTTDADTATAGKQIVLRTENFLEGVTFKESGQYTYKVTETKGNTNYMKYSGAEYTVSIFVEKDGADYVPTSVQIRQDKNDDGLPIDKASKTEYTPGTDNTLDGNFKFENNYDPVAGNNNPGGKDLTDDDKKGFALTKEIAGENPNTSEEFEFTLNVTAPKGSHSDIKASYVVVSGGKDGAAQEVAYGTDFKVNLKHGDRIVFKEILLGSKVVAKETKAGSYNVSIKDGSTVNGVTATIENLTKGLVVGDKDNANFAQFVNTKQAATGLLVDNLPFIALVAVAGAGIAFFVKNREEEEALA